MVDLFHSGSGRFEYLASWRFLIHLCKFIVSSQRAKLEKNKGKMETQRIIEFPHKNMDKRPRKRARLTWDIPPPLPPPKVSISLSFSIAVIYLFVFLYDITNWVCDPRRWTIVWLCKRISNFRFKLMNFLYVCRKIHSWFGSLFKSWVFCICHKFFSLGKKIIIFMLCNCWKKKIA